MYKHPLFRCHVGEWAFCTYCQQFIRTEEAIALGWACPDCGPELTTAWDIRPQWYGVEYLLGK